jgi:ornithine cyclodeaminase/alanine dehydrogenase-like protein (mu-crystallin family)
MDSAKLIKKIEEVFREQTKYLFDKHVPEFNVNGKFLGDFFSQLAVEPRGEEPPVFYYTYSPYDVISNKAPSRAAVFASGEMLLEVDFDQYTALRTAAMSSVVMPTINIMSLAEKRILLIGAGNIATKSLGFLKSTYPELDKVACISRSGDLKKIMAEAKNLGIELVAGAPEDIGQYDIIICHTQADAPILTEDQRSSIKSGAFIASFISSTEHGELADTYFNSSQANVICDWEPTIKGAKEIERSVTDGRLRQDDVIFLNDLLTGKKTIDQTKAYTIYRSTGTPIQNMAVLQLLLEK